MSNIPKLENGDCPECDYSLTKKDLKESVGCGCDACFDEYKNMECPECDLRIDMLNDQLINNFYGSDKPVTPREKQIEAYKLKA